MAVATPLFAGYKEDVQKGVEAQKAGQYEKALGFFNDAQEDYESKKGKESPKLAKAISNLEEKVEAQKANIIIDEGPSTTKKVLQYGLPAVGGILGVVSGVRLSSYNGDKKAFNEKAAGLEGINAETNAELEAERNDLLGDKNMALTLGLIGGGIGLYCLADKLLLHKLYDKKDVKVLSYDPKTNEIKLSCKVNF